MPTLPPILLAALAAAAAGEVELQPVAPGVYAALQPRAGRFDDANSAVIVTRSGVIVVDTQVAPSRARAVLARIRAVSDLPVTTVVNTHWHADHVGGNAAYRDAFPGLELIAHENTREDVAARGQPTHAEELESLPGQLAAVEAQLASGKRRDGRPLSDGDRAVLEAALERGRAHLERLREVEEFVLPETVFAERLTLRRGGTELRLLHFPGHTRGDVVVHLPERRVLVTGDLLDDLPYTGHGSPAALARTLRALDELEFDHVIPGHGEVRHGREHLRLVAELFESIVEQVEAAVAAGKDLEQTQGAVTLDRFREALVTDEASERYWDHFIPEAIARAHAEAAGGPAEP